MADSQRWRATLAEHRTAWLISSASLIIILLAMFWPGVFDFRSSEPDQAIEMADHEPAAAPEPTYSASTPVPVDALTTPVEPEAPAAAPGQAARPMPQQTKPVSLPAVAAKPAGTNSKPVTTSQPRPAAIAPASGTYYVQTGAFKDKAHADKLAASINSKGWPAKVVSKPGNLFAVWVGPKESRGLASALQDSLLKRLNLKGFIIQQKAP